MPFDSSAGDTVEAFSIDDAVNKGMKRIIKHEGPPELWRHRIREPILIGSSSQCMLGQLYGSYNTGMLVLGIRDDTDAHEFAFFSFDNKDEEPAMNARWTHVVSPP